VNLAELFAGVPGDDDVVAVVDGQPIVRGAMRIAVALIREEEPALSEADARRRAFHEYAIGAAAYAEAQRRGITVPRDEARRLVEEHRAQAHEAPAEHRAALEADRRRRGLSEQAYLDSQVEVRQRSMIVGTLYNQVVGELQGASQEQQLAHWHAFAERLLERASIQYKDPSLR
jgi:hypothetical protein